MTKKCDITQDFYLLLPQSQPVTIS